MANRLKRASSIDLDPDSAFKQTDVWQAMSTPPKGSSEGVFASKESSVSEGDKLTSELLLKIKLFHGLDSRHHHNYKIVSWFRF